MFINQYVIITTDQIKTIWEHQYPTCWGSNQDQICPYNIQCSHLFPNTPVVGEDWSPDPSVCDVNLNNTYLSNVLYTQAGTSALSYTEFAGIMAGMLMFGLLANAVGRKGTGILISFFYGTWSSWDDVLHQLLLQQIVPSLVRILCNLWFWSVHVHRTQHN
jgi:hypothetical protein